MKQPKDPLQLPKPTRNTCRSANKLMTVASPDIKLQRKHNVVCHVTKVKSATSAHSMADVIRFFSVFNIRFESNASIKPKENIFHNNTEKNICNIFCTLMFHQLLATKHYRLRDSKFRSRFGRVEVWVWSLTKKQRKINPVHRKNRARPIAARLTRSFFIPANINV